MRNDQEYQLKELSKKNQGKAIILVIIHEGIYICQLVIEQNIHNEDLSQEHSSEPARSCHRRNL